MKASYYEGKDFYAENHVNVIYATSDEGKKNLKKIYKSLISKKTIDFLKEYSGNGQLSKTDLESVLPIWN